MDLPRHPLSRSDFLRGMGWSTVGFLFSGGLGFAKRPAQKSASTDDGLIEKLFEESLVIDGVGSLGTKRGEETVSLAPGEIKRLTGIDMATQGVRVARLVEQNRWLQEHADAFMRIDGASDIDRLRQSNRYGMLYYTQRGFDLKGSVEPLARWKEDGLRSLQITYGDNELGGGSPSNDVPLSALGKKVVEELNRLRMVVDISHSGKRTTLDACAASSQPVTANHANAERLCDHRRNKSDEELQAIAATGGVVGLTTINRFLLRDPSRPATMDDFVAQVDYMVELIGIDHVGLASDSYMDGTETYEVDFSDSHLNSYSRWKHVAGRLHEKGYSRQDLQKILGLNFERVFRQVLDP